MSDNYAKIVQKNLDRLYKNLSPDLEKRLPAQRRDRDFLFDAFGEKCALTPGGIHLGIGTHSSITGILVSLYALNVTSDIPILSPFKSFREFPGSMPFVGAFTTHTEQLLIPHVSRIKKGIEGIVTAFKGNGAPVQSGGDFSFTLFPLPKIALCYIFYEADEDFPPAVTCLFSNNAHQFMPVDGLADVGEYTSKKILNLVNDMAC